MRNGRDIKQHLNFAIYTHCIQVLKVYPSIFLASHDFAVPVLAISHYTDEFCRIYRPHETFAASSNECWKQFIDVSPEIFALLLESVKNTFPLALFILNSFRAVQLTNIEEIQRIQNELENIPEDEWADQPCHVSKSS